MSPEVSSTSSSWASGLVSSRTGARAPLEHGRLLEEQAPWLVEYDLTPERGLQLRTHLPHRPWTLWRYRELLPLARHAERIDLGEGGTPLVSLRRLLPGMSIWIKDESGNPTGSFKARGLSLAINRARELGVSGVEIPSAGNAALAAAAYAAANRLACRIALPGDTPPGIAERCRLFGAEVLIGGSTLVEASQRLAARTDRSWDLSTFKEPYRVEGKKTLGFELAEQLDWDLPDWIVYPTGGGTGIVAMAKAFEELRRLELIHCANSRFLVVQMEGCAPVVEAIHQGSARVTPWKEPRTDVWGLRVPTSLADSLILKAVSESGGTGVAVPESSVGAMQQRVAAQEGLLVGPEGAAALAGLEHAIEQGQITEADRVVVFQTGHPGNYA